MKSEIPIVITVVSCLLSVTSVGTNSIEQRHESPPTNARIEVNKADRVLRLFSGDQLVREFSIGLGFSPKPRKLREGDGATPEGEYSVCVKNPKSKYYLSLGISYPNPDDAAGGLASGLITKKQHDQIIDAHKRGTRPPWNTPLGGEIFIHGSGSGTDWTWGCIALDNQDMLEVYTAARIGTKVVIKP